MNAQNTPVNKEVSTLQPFDNIIDYAEYLDWYLNLFINGLRKDHTDTGDSWLADQTEFIKSIAETDDREICADYLAIGSYGMKMVIQLIDCDPLNYGVKHSPNSWYCGTLMDLAYYEKWVDLNQYIDLYGPGMLYLGYFAIRAVSQERLRLDMINNKTLSAFLLRYEKIVDDPGIEQAVTESYKQLSSFVAKSFYNYTGLDSKEWKVRTNLEDMNLAMVQVLKKKLPDDVRKSLVAAAEGCQSIKKIPEDVARDLINEYNVGKPKKQSKKDNKQLGDNHTDLGSPEESSIWHNLYPKKKIVIREVEEDSPLANIENTILRSQQAKTILEQLQKPRDRKIAELYLYEECNGLQIADILNLPKSNVYRRLEHINSLISKLND